MIQYLSYWRDSKTKKVYVVDENSCGGMSFLNDEKFNLIKITKDEYEKENSTKKKL